MAENWERFKGTPCLNCGRTLDGRFCPDCGQRAADVKQTLWGLLTEYLEHGLSLDSNFARSFKLLILRPGYLTVDYLEGRRARYFSPIRIYLLTSLLFFWSLTLSGALGIDMGDGDDEPEEDSPETEERIVEALEDVGFEDVEITVDERGYDLRLVDPEVEDDVPASAPLDSLVAADEGEKSFWDRLEERIEHNAGQIEGNTEDFVNGLMSNMSKAMFLLVPIFALICLILNARRRQPYLHFMVFALHVHAMYFLVAMLFNVLSHFWNSLEELLATGLFLLFPIYVIMAMRRTFDGTWLRTWAKVTLMMPAYGFCLMLALAIAALAQLLWFV